MESPKRFRNLCLWACPKPAEITVINKKAEGNDIKKVLRFHFCFDIIDLLRLRNRGL